MSSNDQTPGADDGAVLTEQQLAKRWQRSLYAVQQLRREGTGPAYFELGQNRHFRYRLADVEAWEAAQVKKT